MAGLQAYSNLQGYSSDKSFEKKGSCGENQKISFQEFNSNSE